MKEDSKDVLGQLPADFFKQFKSGSDFQGFMDALFKRGVETLLEGELEEHLGYEKHQKALSGNSRNGKTAKTIKTESPLLSLLNLSCTFVRRSGEVPAEGT